MEEQPQGKIIRINILQVSMTLGTYLGLYLILVYAVMLLSISHTILSLLALPMLIGVPVVAYFLVRKFRDKNCQPFFPFPVSWMISILTFLFATVLSCMAAYLYLRFLDHGAMSAGLMEKMEQIVQTSETAISAMTDQVMIDQYTQTMDLLSTTIKWFCSLPASGVAKQLIQSSLMWGNILSLLIALLTMKRIKTNRP